MPWRFSRALGGAETWRPLIEPCASIIAVPFQLVDQLGDPGHLGAGRSPDVPHLHGGQLATSSEANERKDCFRPGRMKPVSTILTDRNLHLQSNRQSPLFLSSCVRNKPKRTVLFSLLVHFCSVPFYSSTSF